MTAIKRIRLAISALCVCLVLPTLPVFAEDSVPAVLSSQNFYVGGQRVELTAYSINGNNYIRLRDIGEAADFSVFYDASMDTVRIDGTIKYVAPLNSVPPTITQTANAVVSNQKFVVNGAPYEMMAYSINDNNYVKLRDVGQALNFCVSYYAETDSVLIDRSLPYGVEITDAPSMTPPEQVNAAADGSGSVSSTPLTEKLLDGSELSREDFSQKANPAVFDSVFTRAAYNAVRQSIIDRDVILANNNADGYNLFYRYANFIDQNYSPSGVPGETCTALNKVLWNFNGYYEFTLGVEPYVKNRYDYPGYRICKATTHDFYAPANEATDDFVKSVKALTSDRDKIKQINDCVCEHLNYGDGHGMSVNTIFTSESPTLGECGDYSNAINYLCQRVGIPCVIVASETHSWNKVFIDGKWYVLDATANDIDPPNYNVIYLVDTHPDYSDLYPQHTLFAEELLVPGGTL